jgi:hypothetical protein
VAPEVAELIVATAVFDELAATMLSEEQVALEVNDTST